MGGGRSPSARATPPQIPPPPKRNLRRNAFPARATLRAMRPWSGRLRIPAIATTVLVACGGGSPVAAPTTPAAAPAGGLTTEAAATDAAAEPAEPELEPSEPFGTTTIELSDPEGGNTIAMPVYDAFVPDTRQLGLMHREELPADAGMVFRFPDDRTGGFWMRNTLIPLSIAYFDADGTVVTVLDMEPCTTITCPSYPPGAVYRGALEVNQGYFSEIGLEPGWQVALPDGLPAAS